MSKSRGAASASPCTSLPTTMMRINKFLHQLEFIFVTIVHFPLKYKFYSSVLYIMFDKQNGNLWKSDGILKRPI